MFLNHPSNARIKVDTIANALKGTPWWVYVLLFYLLSIGKKALKPQVVSLKRLALLPIVFIVWSTISIATTFSFSILKWLCWLLSACLGSLLGYLLTRSISIQADKKKFLIALPATYSTLILLIMIFSIKYTFGYLYAVHPELVNNVWFTTTDIVASGVITGIFIGRFVTYLYKLYHAKHTDLHT
jgi:hypothetical protein